MEVVGNQLAYPAVVLEHPLNGLVGGAGDLAWQVQVILLQRPPAAFEEFIAAGVNVSPGRHAGCAAAPAVVKYRSAGGKPVHVGSRNNPVRLFLAPAFVERSAVVVRAAMVATEGVAEDDDDVHVRDA